MNLDKAIEILSNHGVKPEGATWQDYLDAVKLGIEAIKRLKQNRTLHFIPSLKPLPEETTDPSIIDPQHDNDVSKTLQRRAK